MTAKENRMEPSSEPRDVREENMRKDKDAQREGSQESGKQSQSQSQ